MRRTLAYLRVASDRAHRAYDAFCEQRVHERLPLSAVAQMRLLAESADDALSVVQSIADRDAEGPVLLDSLYQETP